MQCRHHPAIGEAGTVTGVQVALGRQALGQHDVVRIEFDVPVADGSHFDLRDGRMVHQVPDRDEHAIHEYRMVGGKEQRSPWCTCTEGVRCDLHRKYSLCAWVSGELHSSMADPANRPKVAAHQGCDLIADVQVLHLYFAAAGPDACPGGEAGQRNGASAAVCAQRELVAGISAQQGKAGDG